MIMFEGRTVNEEKDKTHNFGKNMSVSWVKSRNI
jgi:hypothetical protein